jgi:hypothetical protein
MLCEHVRAINRRKVSRLDRSHVAQSRTAKNNTVALDGKTMLILQATVAGSNVDDATRMTFV